MKTDLNNLRRYGVELEFVSNHDRYEMARLIEEATGQHITIAGYSDKSNKWRLKSDSSVSGRGMYGMELVTPILHGESDMELLKSIVAVCEANGSVNRTCGMHVHVDITNAEATPLKKLMKFFAKYENAIGGVLSESRRGSYNGYCRDHFQGTENLVGIFKNLNGKEVRNLIGHRFFSQRGKWNFQNYWRHGTVENRAHQGTLNVAKVENWVRLTQAIVACAFESRGQVAHADDTTSTYTTKDMLDDLRGKKYITLPVKKFYMNRYKELNNAVCR